MYEWMNDIFYTTVQNQLANSDPWGPVIKIKLQYAPNQTKLKLG